MKRENLRFSGIPGKDVGIDHALFSMMPLQSNPVSQLTDLIETIPTAVFVVERSMDETVGWTLVGTNAQHNALAGLEGQIGNPFDQWCPPEQCAFLYENYAFAVDRWEQVSYTERITLPAGVRWWNTSLMPIRSADGRIRLVGSAVDGSHTRNAEDALSTFMPMCGVCKSVKVQGDDGNSEMWKTIETFLEDHKFSHGFCPECFNRLYGHLK